MDGETLGKLCRDRWFAWHDVLDRELGTEGAEDRQSYEKHAEDTFFCDYRTHFATWRMPPAAIRECFEMLPKGGEIADRVLDEQVWEYRHLPDRKSVENDMRQAIKEFDLECELPYDADQPIEFVCGSQSDLDAIEEKSTSEAFYYDLLEVGQAMTWTEPPEEIAASLFVHETLYRKIGYTDGVFLALWPYGPDKRGTDLFRWMVRLDQTPFTICFDETGPIVFLNEDDIIQWFEMIERADLSVGDNDITPWLNDWIVPHVPPSISWGYPAHLFENMELTIQYRKHPHRLFVDRHPGFTFPKNAPKNFFEKVKANSSGLSLQEGERVFFRRESGDVANPEFELILRAERRSKK